MIRAENIVSVRLPPAEQAWAEYVRFQVRSFLIDCCDTDVGAEVQASKLYEAYERWARNKIKISNTSFGRQLTAAGLMRRQSNVNFWVGIRLRQRSSQSRSKRR